MVGIITGDIMNSKATDPKIWLESLKAILNSFGKTPEQWEVYRGDSFQLEIKPENALKAAVLIKSTIKQFKNLDVRMAIGFGDKTFVSEKITESNGSAFVNSGACFENLKNITLAIKTPFENFDYTINTMLELILLTVNNWSITSSKLVKIALENPELNQAQLAKIFGSTQGNVSKGLKRAGFDEISKLLNYYETQTKIL